MFRKAKRDDMAVYAMSDITETVVVDWDFTAEEFEKIQLGKVPQETGDRNFIFFEDDCLYINEASGYPVFKVFFSEANGKFRAFKLIIEKDPKRRRVRDNRFDVADVKEIIKYTLGLRRFE